MNSAPFATRAGLALQGTDGLGVGGNDRLPHPGESKGEVTMIGPSFLTAVLLATSPTPAAMQGTIAEAAKAEEPKICRREAVTGSKARMRKVCMTKMEWKTLWLRTRESNNELEARSGRIGCVDAGATGVC